VGRPRNIEAEGTHRVTSSSGVEAKFQFLVSGVDFF